MNKRFILGIGGVAALVAGLSTLLIDRISPRDMTTSAITETFVRIGLYAQRNHAIPLSLDVLPKREGYANRTTDGWNRPLLFEVSSNGVIRLTSFGKDGRPGGSGEDTDIAKAYYTRKPDGSLWAGSKMWIVEAEVVEDHRDKPVGVATHARPFAVEAR